MVFGTGTAYPIVILAEPYDRSKVVFSSHDDLPQAQQRALRLVDVAPGVTKEGWIAWQVPTDLKPNPYYLKCEIWNPPHLYGGSDPIAAKWRYRFHSIDWIPALEIVPGTRATGGKLAPKVFISYAAFSENHREWVTALRNQLVRNGIDVILAETDLRSPMEITLFMEEGIKQSDAVILVCSNVYVEKANRRQGGVGYETVITSKMFADSNPQRRKWIPILRDNTLASGECIPIYLGSTMWIDMNSAAWDGRPLGDLLQSIRAVSAA